MPVANFLLALIAIFVAAKLFGELAERIGQPAVLGELVGGVVVGVSGFHLGDPRNDTVHLLAQLAIVPGSLLAPHLIRLIERIQLARGLFFVSLIFALTLPYLAEGAGTAIIIGSFAAGLVLARTEKGREIERQARDVVQFFVPIFF